MLLVVLFKWNDCCGEHEFYHSGRGNQLDNRRIQSIFQSWLESFGVSHSTAGSKVIFCTDGFAALCHQRRRSSDSRHSTQPYVYMCCGKEKIFCHLSEFGYYYVDLIYLAPRDDWNHCCCCCTLLTHFSFVYCHYRSQKGNFRYRKWSRLKNTVCGFAKRYCSLF